MIKPYKYKIPRPKREELPSQRIQPQGDEGDIPPLTGYWGDVQLGSAEEERLLRGLSKLGRNVQPQFEVPTPYSLRGQGKQIDGIIWDFLLPYEVDSVFHNLETSKAQDDERDALLNDILGKKGFQPIRRIDGAKYLQNQTDADNVASELN